MYELLSSILFSIRNINHLLEQLLQRNYAIFKYKSVILATKHYQSFHSCTKLHQYFLYLNSSLDTRVSTYTRKYIRYVQLTQKISIMNFVYATQPRAAFFNVTACAYTCKNLPPPRLASRNSYIYRYIRVNKYMTTDI